MNKLIQQLTALVALRKEATPGPWRYAGASGTGVSIDGGHQFRTDVAELNDENAPYEDNGAFIAAAGSFDFDTLLQALTAGPQWVSVKERLPEASRQVLTVFASGAYSNTTREPVLALFMPVDNFGRSNQFVVGGGFIPADKFTHWMPLPAAPAKMEGSQSNG